MSELKLQKTVLTAKDGTSIQLVYDPEADILEIFFGENGPATGIELTDQMVLRVDQKQKRALSLVLLHFSILSEQTEYGPRSFSIDKVQHLPAELRQLVLRLLTSQPVSQFLKLSQFQLSPQEQMPLAYVESQPAAVYA